MWKRCILVVAVAGVVPLILIALRARAAREPIYHGHSLSRWVAILAEGGHEEETIQQAREAIAHIGTNATPFLLAWIQFEPKPGPFRSKLANPYNWDAPEPLSLRDRLLHEFRSRRERVAEGAPEAFEALGARAIPAVPELTRLMNSRTAPITALRAALALALMGTNGLPPLLAAIDDPEHQNRFEAVRAIDMLPDNVVLPAEQVVPHLIPCVTDRNNGSIARVAVYALRKFGSAPQLVIPALTNCLSSPDARTRWWSVNALMALNPPAAPALPALTNALNDPDPSVRRDAGFAVSRIASEARRTPAAGINR